MVIIYISGIDGCGKTTQSTMLVEFLRQGGLSAEYQWLRWEPSILPMIQRFRKLAGSKVKVEDKDSENRIKSAENTSHGSWKNLKSRLMSSSGFRRAWLWYATQDYSRAYRKASRNWSADYVVMDRYIMDFVIDQSLNFGIPPNAFIKTIQSSALANVQLPQLSIFIDIPAKVGYERKLDGTPLEYLKERENLYRGLDADHIFHIDGTLSVNEIHEQIATFISANLVKDDE